MADRNWVCYEEDCSSLDLNFITQIVWIFYIDNSVLLNKYFSCKSTIIWRYTLCLP